MMSRCVTVLLPCLALLLLFGCSSEEEEFTPPLAITTTALADATQGGAYSQTLAATGGATPYTWSLTSGALPAALSLNATTGEISGTPTATGTSNFTARVTDSASQTDDQALSITVTPNSFPRLLVANGPSPGGGAVKIWNNVDGCAADQASNATLGGFSTDGALRLALDGNRLFAAGNDSTTAMYIWDNASTLGNGAAPTTTLPVTSFAGTALSTVYDMFVDGNGQLWVGYGYVRLFLNASSLTSSSTSQAQFTHQWGPQIFAMASDTTGNKLIGGQVSGAGAIVWNNPASKTGETNADDWTLKAFGTASFMTISGNRLYMGSATTLGGSGYVNIWNNISSITAGQDPNVTMTGASSLAGVVHVQVKNNFLVATVSNPPTYQVNIYANASSISGETTPTFQITDTSMVLPRKAHLANDGRLYVLDQNGLLIFRGATTTPAFVCEITTDISSPRDFLIME